jgi:hypothetical protein
MRKGARTDLEPSANLQRVDHGRADNEKLREQLLALVKKFGVKRVGRVWKSIASAVPRGAPKKQNLFTAQELAEFVDSTERGYRQEIGLKNVHQLAMQMVWQAEVSAGSKASYASFKSLVRKGRELKKKQSEQK